MKKVNLIYCLYTAHSDCGVNEHAKVVMRNLGITYKHATRQSLYDAWQFWNCENVPENLPKYITINKNDPMKFVGYGLSQEMAIEIKKEGKK